MKNLMRFLAFFLMVGGTYAQSNLPVCQGRNITVWSNCAGSATFNDGNRYVGEFKDGKLNGQGTYTFTNGDKYVGEFKDDKRNEQGTFTFANGNKYVGEYKDDIQHGQGTYTFANGNKYIGAFKDGKRNGQGTFTFANGNKYVGEYKDDKRNGQGTQYAANGSISNEGIWADGNFVRTAPVQQASGTNQNVAVATQQLNISQSNLPVCSGSGNFENCFGTYTFPSGEKYVGEFKNNLRHGQGTFYTSSGLVVSEGIWSDGKFLRSATVQRVSETNSDMARLRACQGITSTWNNCFGEVKYPDGDTFAGTFKDGKRDGLGTHTSFNGNKFVGEFKDGKPNGQGTHTFANGNKYVGEYKDNKRNGQFTVTLANGNKYVGQYKDDKRNGQGTEYAANGSIINQGMWADGSFVRTAPVQQATTPNTAIEKIRAEAEVSKRLLAQAEDQKRIQTQLAEIRLRELEEQLKQAKQQNQVAPPTAMTTMANRKALVIGNDSYKSVSKLLNAREDAKAMASSLESVGYKVTLQLDLNEKEMKTALRTFSSQVQGGDEVMFFFAGHGVQLGATNYLLPTDIGGESEAQVKDEAIQLQRVLDDMTEKKAKFTLAMIDACRDNPFKSAGRNIGGRGLAPTTAATGQMVVFSAGTGQQALDRLGNNDKNKNGVFTRTFLKEMQKSGVSIDRIVKNVRNEVAELAKTVGHEQVPAIYDQVLGDFYFKK